MAKTRLVLEDTYEYNVHCTYIHTELKKIVFVQVFNISYHIHNIHIQTRFRTIVPYILILRELRCAYFVSSVLDLHKAARVPRNCNYQYGTAPEYNILRVPSVAYSNYCSYLNVCNVIYNV